MSDDIEILCAAKCQHCRDKARLRYRDDTREWVHDTWVRGQQAHTICAAHDLRMENNG